MLGFVDCSVNFFYEVRMCKRGGVGDGGIGFNVPSDSWPFNLITYLSHANGEVILMALVFPQHQDRTENISIC